MTPSDTRQYEWSRINEQIEELKRLMIVQLLASGVQSAHIAKVLGVHPSAVSRIAPAREIQRMAKRGARKVESDG